MLELLRYAVFVAFACSAGIAIGSWAVRTQRINPFSPPGRLIRRVSDPILRPIEHWQLRSGGNPHNAPWWLLGIAVVGGIVLISLSEWLVGFLARASRAGRTGPRGVLRLLVYYAGQLVSLAILVRVIGSWLGAGRYNRWTRWSYALSDWIVEPLRRVLPPFGAIDLSPIAAWFLIQFIILPLLLRIL